MPTLKIPDHPLFYGPSTYRLTILPVMLYPRESDATKRRHWLASAIAGEYSRWESEGVSEKVLRCFHGWIAVLWDLRLSPRRVYQDGQDRMGRAVLTGHVLLYLLSMARHHPRHCKVDRAKALVVEFAPAEDVAASESLVDKAWAEFKGASPFWAALTAIHHHGQWPAEGKGWLRLVGVGEHYRQAAVDSRLLNEDETWRAPSSIKREGFKLNPLPPDLVEFLDRSYPV